MKFLLEYSRYNDGTKICNGWWKISADEKYVENRCGGFHDYIKYDDDIVVEANNWDDLDYSYLINPDSPYGWLAPDGTFIGCNYADHSAIITRVLKFYSENEAENNGYIKIFRDFNGKRSWYMHLYILKEVSTIKYRLTKQQKDWLLLNNLITVKYYDIL